MATSAPAETLPCAQSIQLWVDNALADHTDREQTLSVRIVDADEMTSLNQSYRSKDGVTNVLSFPVEADDGLPPELLAELPLGDIVLCHPVVVTEAQQQHKELEHHYAHMVTHGVLHLCGYDHIEDAQAQQMEALEVELLKRLNIPNPYV